MTVVALRCGGACQALLVWFVGLVLVMALDTHRIVDALSGKGTRVRGNSGGDLGRLWARVAMMMMMMVMMVMMTTMMMMTLLLLLLLLCLLLLLL
jgi:hypothetical protein